MIQQLHDWLVARDTEWSHEALVRADQLLELELHESDAWRRMLGELCARRDIWVVYRRPKSQWASSDIVAHRARSAGGGVLGQPDVPGCISARTRCGKQIAECQLVDVQWQDGERAGLERPVGRDDRRLLLAALHGSGGRIGHLCAACLQLPRWDPYRRRARQVATLDNGAALPVGQPIEAGTRVAIGPDGTLVPATAGALSVGVAVPCAPTVTPDGRVAVYTIE